MSIPLLLFLRVNFLPVAPATGPAGLNPLSYTQTLTPTHNEKECPGTCRHERLCREMSMCALCFDDDDDDDAGDDDER